MGAHDALDVVALSEQVLRDWPLPAVAADGDKEVRGSVLIVAGSFEMPGAAILAATNALRAGAGKLTVATDVRVAQHVAMAVPEARVVGMRLDGSEVAACRETLGADAADAFDAVVIGPGMPDDDGCASVIRALLAVLAGTQLILDAVAMRAALRSDEHNPRGARGGTVTRPRVPFPASMRVLLTPHAGEMAKLTGLSKEAVAAAPAAVARDASASWNAVVALKGATTYIAAPAGRVWRHDGGHVGLASSGSGDALAGIIGGLAARGAPLDQAAAWGVALHARAGERLAAQIGPLGFLAREIGGQIPALMREWSPQQE